MEKPYAVSNIAKLSSAALRALQLTVATELGKRPSADAIEGHHPKKMRVSSNVSGSTVRNPNCKVCNNTRPETPADLGASVAPWHFRTKSFGKPSIGSSCKPCQWAAVQLGDSLDYDVVPEGVKQAVMQQRKHWPYWSKFPHCA